MLRFEKIVMMVCVRRMLNNNHSFVEIAGVTGKSVSQVRRLAEPTRRFASSRSSAFGRKKVRPAAKCGRSRKTSG